MAQPSLSHSQKLLRDFSACNEIDVSNVVWALVTHLRSPGPEPGLHELMDSQRDMQHGKVSR